MMSEENVLQAPECLLSIRARDVLKSSDAARLERPEETVWERLGKMPIRAFSWEHVHGHPLLWYIARLSPITPPECTGLQSIAWDTVQLVAYYREAMRFIGGSSARTIPDMAPEQSAPDFLNSAAYDIHTMVQRLSDIGRTVWPGSEDMTAEQYEENLRVEQPGVHPDAPVLMPSTVDRKVDGKMVSLSLGIPDPKNPGRYFTGRPLELYLRAKRDLEMLEAIFRHGLSEAKGLDPPKRISGSPFAALAVGLLSITYSAFSDFGPNPELTSKAVAAKIRKGWRIEKDSLKADKNRLVSSLRAPEDRGAYADFLHELFNSEKSPSPFAEGFRRAIG